MIGWIKGMNSKKCGARVSSSFEECLRSEGEIRSYTRGAFPLHITNDVLLERFQHILFVRNEKH